MFLVINTLVSDYWNDLVIVCCFCFDLLLFGINIGVWWRKPPTKLPEKWRQWWV